MVALDARPPPPPPLTLINGKRTPPLAPMIAYSGAPEVRADGRPLKLDSFALSPGWAAGAQPDLIWAHLILRAIHFL